MSNVRNRISTRLVSHAYMRNTLSLLVLDARDAKHMFQQESNHRNPRPDRGKEQLPPLQKMFNY